MREYDFFLCYTDGKDYERLFHMQKKIYRVNIILFICAIACLISYDIFGGLWLKGFTSFWFVLLGFVNVIYAWKKDRKISGVVILIELGLICGMCADVLLATHFILGILFFATGHVLYLIAFYNIEKFCRRDVWIILPIAVISLIIVTGNPYISIEDPLMKKLLVGYAVIIACMLGKAISNITIQKSTFRWLILLGSFMFWFSDFMLAIDMFGTPSRLTWILCSYNYWPAQNILALSLFFYTSKEL